VFEKLGKNPEFQKVYREGRPKANKYLVMYVKTGESGPSRYGFSVSKKSVTVLCVIALPDY
jgi:ribonuclease P protein component